MRATPLRPVRPGDTSVTYKPTPIQGNSLVRDFEHAQLETMAEVWWWVVGRYGDRRLLGTRDVLGEQEEIQPNGTVFMKLDLGEYRLVRLLNFPLERYCGRWMSYEEADVLADQAGRGLRMTGQQSGSPVAILADTRAEWLLTAQGCFKQGFPVVTLYTNLGEEAVRHGLTETEVETVITSHELLPRFRSILKQTPHVKRVIYFENPIKRADLTGEI